MKIKGIVEYNNNGIIMDEKFDIDTTVAAFAMSDAVADAISFALFGKTVYQPIVRAEKGVPLIVMEIIGERDSITIVRQPQYMRETAFGSRYLSKEVFSIKTEKEEYPELSSEKYFTLLSGYIDLSYDEFSAYCRS